jgi:hypothetical protein
LATEDILMLYFKKPNAGREDAAVAEWAGTYAEGY